ncbi:MAG: hypothetical protein EOP19_10925 [Hyphomicrobiales bacterium]|nr:MAG: hypothetical protein EOP19_10925 [Hyphomicrobiales bacterium]
MASLCFILGASPASADGPEGSWLCVKEAAIVGTLGMRPAGYVLIRAGQAVAKGDYQTDGGAITVVSGPLKEELNLASGVLDEAQSPRTISFTSDAGAVVCREVR